MPWTPLGKPNYPSEKISGSTHVLNYKLKFHIFIKYFLWLAILELKILFIYMWISFKNTNINLCLKAIFKVCTV